MSYCVNCGVELDKTASRCPLCNTPIYNPRELADLESPPPFPTERGTVEKVKRTDLAILLTTVLAGTSLTCLTLNLLVFDSVLWSAYVIGICMVLWVFFLPALVNIRFPIYLLILFDGIAVVGYLFIIALQVDGQDWFMALALPIASLVTVLIMIFAFLMQFVKRSILTTSLYLFIGLAVLCVGIELCIRFYLERQFSLTWSAVVLACCTIISIALITVISRSRLREEVRRRMHM